MGRETLLGTRGQWSGAVSRYQERSKLVTTSVNCRTTACSLRRTPDHRHVSSFHWSGLPRSCSFASGKASETAEMPPACFGLSWHATNPIARYPIRSRPVAEATIDAGAPRQLFGLQRSIFRRPAHGWHHQTKNTRYRRQDKFHSHGRLSLLKIGGNRWCGIVMGLVGREAQPQFWPGLASQWCDRTYS